MTLLDREDPSRLMPIEGDVSIKIQEALVSLGLLEQVDHERFPPVAQRALRDYGNINNFENKMREDGKIWRSVFEYLLDDAGMTP